MLHGTPAHSTHAYRRDTGTSTYDHNYTDVQIDGTTITASPYGYVYAKQPYIAPPVPTIFEGVWKVTATSFTSYDRPVLGETYTITDAVVDVNDRIIATIEWFDVSEGYQLGTMVYDATAQTIAVDIDSTTTYDHNYTNVQVDAATITGEPYGYIFEKISDSLPPSPITNFSSIWDSGNLTLSWTNPTDSDFAGVKIVRKQGSYPNDPNDGTVVFNDYGTTFTDLSAKLGYTYYYAAYSYDDVPNYSDVTELLDKPDQTVAVNQLLSQAGFSIQFSAIIDEGQTNIYREMALTSFAITETEVTVGDYELLAGITVGDPYGYGTSKDLPIYDVTWRQAVLFCNALSSYLGFEPIYDESTWVPDFQKNGFYLPIEAQWEYAAGGPDHLVWSLGDTFVSDDYVWDDGTPPVSPEIVKNRPANGFGLYEMSGNMQEWCTDYAGPRAYPYTGQTDPYKSSYSDSRVLKGGGFNDHEPALQCESYSSNNETVASTTFGFRVAWGGFGKW